MKPPLTDTDYEAAATRLGCEVAAIKAVAEVESGPHGGFLPDDTPVILFERHLFARLTNHVYDHAHPAISNPSPGGYGKVLDQPARLAEASALDRDAALQACSWGRFQVLGANWRDLDYESLQQFVNAMYAGEAEQLDSFVRFIQHNGLTGALRTHNWTAFARRYNGPNFHINHYDTKLAEAYARHK
jgi:hypothetical protein